ncbi:ABC transporter ATP-binding protein [Cryptosporangium japonicum]|uniref:ABC transporter ATP-binding protein n=1 Tax=Cryptosporangium japonicum TaxID=80872 RepID=A0ABP3DTL8_9ACTN
MRVHATGIDVALAGRTIVADAVLDAPPGAFVGLLGPNGSGKTTLLRAVYRALRPARGAVLLGDADVWSLTARQAARRAAVVMQDDPTDFEFTVREVVALGRVPHQGLLGRASDDDRRAVDDALARTGADHLAERPVSSLSGGERQRVYLARALAQDTPVLVLDEPTNHLDVTAQLELLELVRGLGVTVVAALHDLNLAAAYCDRIYVLRAGRVVASGPVAEVLTAAVISEVYGVRAALVTHPLTGQPAFLIAAPSRLEENS